MKKFKKINPELHKEVVSNLTNDGLGQIKGGDKVYPLTYYTICNCNETIQNCLMTMHNQNTCKCVSQNYCISGTESVCICVQTVADGCHVTGGTINYSCTCYEQA